MKKHLNLTPDPVVIACETIPPSGYVAQVKRTWKTVAIEFRFKGFKFTPIRGCVDKEVEVLDMAGTPFSSMLLYWIEGVKGEYESVIVSEDVHTVSIETKHPIAGMVMLVPIVPEEAA